MLSFSSIIATVGPSELAGLLLLAAVIFAQHKASFGKRKNLIFGLVFVQLALPALMAVSAAVFSHDRGVIRISRSTESRLSYLLFGLYLFQMPVGLLIAFFLTSLVRKTKYQMIIASLSLALLLIQMYHSFILMLLASLEISGDSM